MKKLWGKIYKNNRLIKNYAADINSEITIALAGDVTDALAEICERFDIENPIWFEANYEEFARRQKTIFRPGNFIDEPRFDRMEIEVIEEK